MNRNAFIIPAAILIVFLFSSISSSQVVGKIYSQDDANKLFGDVLGTVTMNRSELLPILSQTQNYVMFRVADDELMILGDGRKVLYPIGNSVNPNDVFYVVSKSKVTELLNLSASIKVNFEVRQKTQTVTSGTFTLEEALLCPPFCP